MPRSTKTTFVGQRIAGPKEKAETPLEYALHSTGQALARPTISSWLKKLRSEYERESLLTK